MREHGGKPVVRRWRSQAGGGDLCDVPLRQWALATGSDDVGCVGINTSAGGASACGALRQGIVRTVGDIQVGRVDLTVALVAGVHGRVDDASGEQGAFWGIGRLLVVEEILNIAAQVAEVRERPLVL